MKKIRTAAVVVAVAAGLMSTGGVATAETESCTRQYVVSSDTTLRDAPGGNVLVAALITDKFNVPSPSGVWYEGNLYDRNNTFLGHGYIMASTLSYLGVCF